jgi:hypothetical protein
MVIARLRTKYKHYPGPMLKSLSRLKSACNGRISSKRGCRPRERGDAIVPVWWERGDSRVPVWSCRLVQSLLAVLLCWCCSISGSWNSNSRWAPGVRKYCLMTSFSVCLSSSAAFCRTNQNIFEFDCISVSSLIFLQRHP